MIGESSSTTITKNLILVFVTNEVIDATTKEPKEGCKLREVLGFIVKFRGKTRTFLLELCFNS